MARLSTALNGQHQHMISSTEVDLIQMANLNLPILMSLTISFWMLHKSLLKIAHTYFTMVELWSCLLDSIQLRIFSTTLNTVQLHNLNPIACLPSPISFYLWHKSLLKMVHTNFTMVELWSGLLDSTQLRILSMTLITLQLCNLNATIYLSLPILLWLDFQLHLKIAHTNLLWCNFGLTCWSSINSASSQLLWIRYSCTI